MAGWLGRATFFALPARYEPFGLAVLEAALSGCALVLGDIPTLRELWDGVAAFVPPGDIEALEDVLTQLIADPDLRSEEHTSELQSLMRISYAVFCLKQKNKTTPHTRCNQRSQH